MKLNINEYITTITILKKNKQQVNKLCPKCNGGTMHPNGNILNEGDKIFEHQCVNCKHKENFKLLYPYVILD